MFRHSAAALEFVDRLGELVKDQAQWSQATFGSDEERGPLGALVHLEKEAKEAGDEWKAGEANKGTAVRYITAEYQYELADCFLLLLDAMRRSGMGLLELLRAAECKMSINKSRTWPKPTSDAPVEHVKEEENARDLLHRIVVAAISTTGLDSQDKILVLERIIGELSEQIGHPRENMPQAPYVYPSGFVVGERVRWNEKELANGIRKYNTHITFQPNAILEVMNPPCDDFPEDAVEIKETNWPHGEGAVDSWCLWKNLSPTPSMDDVAQPSIKRKALDNSYTAYCLFCDSRVHKNNAVGICPNCYAQGKRPDSAPESQSTLK